MNILLDALVDAVEIAGIAVPINTSYKVGIMFENLMLRTTAPDDEKIIAALMLYYGENIGLITDEDIPEAVEKMLWFYKCGYTKEEEDDDDESGKRVFSYEHDADYIYDAFLIAYGVDLTQVDLHWWKFRAMFRSLPDTTQFMKIVGYRAMKIPDKASREEKRHYAKMKKLFALPKEELIGANERKVADELEKILMEGGNPSSVIGEGASDQ